MCDCYDHRCSSPGCTATVPVHIGDFKFPRSRFRVWCPAHVDDAWRTAVIFTVLETIKEEGYRRGDRVAIWGPEVGISRRLCNHPNLFSEMLVNGRMPSRRSKFYRGCKVPTDGSWWE
ncbi:MAG: hypothetical protein WC683_00880 [bacterium]